MPTPQAGESRKQFVSRCIPIVLEHGTAENQEQAVAVCNSMWEEHSVTGLDALIERYAVTKSEADGNHPASHYLIVEDPDSPTTWHLRVKNASGSPDHRLMGAAWAALHEGYRGNKYGGPNKQEAINKLRRLYAAEDMSPPGGNMNSEFLIDQFVSLKPGEPFRLFPFGKIVKNGRPRNVTPELARKFKLPHFKPPIKLGDHSPSAPAGGFITGLEVREDGLWAQTELNDEGLKAAGKGSFKYESPEVIWQEGALENPETGEPIRGPLIVGAAWLHTPHLGEAAALYSVEPFEQEDDMSETVTVPVSLWDRMTAIFDRQPEPEPDPNEEQVTAEQFAAVQKDRDDYKAKVEAMEAETAKAERLTAIAGEFEKVEALKEDSGLFEMLAGIEDEEQRKALVTKFKALGEQVAGLTNELGTEEEGDTDLEADSKLDKAIKAKMAEDEKLDYNGAMEAIRAEKPELFSAYDERAERIRQKGV